MSQLKIKDGNSWIGIPAGGMGVPSGGSSGQYLKKSSSTDYATEWADVPKDWTLIWTNPSPTSDFAGEINVPDLSNYSEIKIWLTDGMPNPEYWIRSDSSVTCSIFSMGVTSSSYFQRRRTFFFTSMTKITFGDCWEHNQSNSYQKSNSSCRPYKIFAR